jgi:hypothetical protein
MKQTGKEIGWEVNSQYTTKTKTLFALTATMYPNEVSAGIRFEPYQVEEIVEQLDVVGFTKNSYASVAMYMGALNGTVVCQRIKLNKCWQREINAFRKAFGFKTIKFA